MCIQTQFKMSIKSIQIDVSTHVFQLIKLGVPNDEIIEAIRQISSFWRGPDSPRQKLLPFSVRCNNIAFTQYLLTKNCYVNCQDSLGFTPLMLALMGNQESLTRIILTAGADIFKKNYEGKSALHIVAEKHEIRDEIIELIFKELLKKCSTAEEIGKNLVDAGFCLPKVLLLKQAKVLKYVLKHGNLDVNHADYENQMTALHIVTKLNDWECVNLLLKYNANTNALDSSNCNPLFYVYEENEEHSHGKTEILKALVRNGASMTSCVSDGQFNATHTLTHGSREAVRGLLDSGLDFIVKDVVSGATVLHYLATNLNPGVADELKFHVGKFNVNIADRNGYTPLTMAAMAGNLSMLKFLLKQGARTEVKHSFHGFTPLWFAYRHSKLNYQQCGEMLLEYDANPQILGIDINGETVTIFDRAFKKNDLDRMLPVIAYLAILEKRGTPITETTWEKINSHKSLKKYFEKCKKQLTKKISGRLVLFDLLNSDKKKIARYLNDEHVAKKIWKTCGRLKTLKLQYYCDVLNRRCLEGKYYKKLKNKTSRVISKFFKNRIHKTHLVIDNIVDYLDDKSLRQMSRLYYYQLSNRKVTFTRISKKLKTNVCQRCDQLYHK